GSAPRVGGRGAVGLLALAKSCEHSGQTTMSRALLVVLFAVSASSHPLTPLSAAEIRDAVRIYRASGHAPASARFHFIALDEPPKDAVLRHASVPRRAFAVIYDRATNRTGEAVADLTAGKLASWKEIPG